MLQRKVKQRSNVGSNPGKMVVREVLSDKVTLKQNPEGGEGASPVTTWEKSIPERGNSCTKALRIGKEAGGDDVGQGKMKRPVRARQHQALWVPLTGLISIALTNRTFPIIG